MSLMNCVLLSPVSVWRRVYCGNVHPRNAAEYLDRIALEVEHLDQLIGQLLTLARIDSRADSSRKEKVELSSLLQEVAVDGNFEAQAKSCAVKVDSIDVCMTTGAREQLRR